MRYYSINCEIKYCLKKKKGFEFIREMAQTFVKKITLCKKKNTKI